MHKSTEFVKTKSDKNRVLLNTIHYPNAGIDVLVMDNLNTHNTASWHTAIEPKHARELAERFEIHYTPKHES